MEGMVLDTISSMQDMGDYYTKKLEVEKRRHTDLENKLRVRVHSARSCWVRTSGSSQPCGHKLLHTHAHGYTMLLT